MCKIRNTHATNGYGLLVTAGDDSAVQSFRVANQDDSITALTVKGDGNVLCGGITGASGYGALETTTFATEGQCVLNHTGSGNVIMMNLPTADPEVAGALYTDGATSAGVPKALMISGG